MSTQITIFNKTFWDLWLQKCLRNFSSVKYQWMTLLYVPIVYGMFTINELTKQPWISSSTGLAYLAGGFVTLATGRIIARTRLTEDLENFDSDK